MRSLRSVRVFSLLAFVARAEIQADDGGIGNVMLVDELVDSLSERVRHASHPHRSGFDNSTLGKSGSLAASPRTRPSFGAHPSHVARPRAGYRPLHPTRAFPPITNKGTVELPGGVKLSRSAIQQCRVATCGAVPEGLYCEATDQCVRRKTRTVTIGNVKIGSEHPIAIQTMTTTKTDDVEATVAQIKKCAEEGIDIVRITVQGMREAKACEAIRNRLDEDGCFTPIVADIHFTPKVALACADFVDKVRVNPGNFADGRKSFDTVDQDANKEALDKEAKEHIEEVFSPLVLKLKEQGKAMRIGVNHGSLAERILFQYGDTPEGMVAHAVEFAEICRKYDYHNFCFSMKASNPKVMVAAYRALAREMYKREWDYPLHLGVTEAGGGSDGRIKSASGIGTLLLDGLGDTIRVSLTEDPEYEAKPCISLRKVAELASGKGVEPFDEPKDRREGLISRRKCKFPFDVRLNTDGSVLAKVTTEELVSLDTTTLCELFDLRLRQDGDIQKDWKSTDAVVVEGEMTSEAAEKVQVLLEATIGVLTRPGDNLPPGCTLMHDGTDAAAGPVLPDRIGGRALIFDGTEPTGVIAEALKNVAPRLILFRPENQEGINFLGRKLFTTLANLEGAEKTPVMLWFRYPSVEGQDEDDIVVRASADFGSLFLDGFGEGVLWEAADLSPNAIRESSFNLLQACRMRISKTEFISCPSCGRTLFDLQEVTAKIEKRTGHLPGVRIAIMGCIVNGPGEMADADFGYVGSGVGKIDLYVNYDCVQRGISSENGVDKLIDLIKEHGRWQEPPDAVVTEDSDAIAVPR